MDTTENTSAFKTTDEVVAHQANVFATLRPGDATWQALVTKAFTYAVAFEEDVFRYGPTVGTPARGTLQALASEIAEWPGGSPLNDDPAQVFNCLVGRVEDYRSVGLLPEWSLS